MQGRLVPQDPNDETAEEALNRVGNKPSKKITLDKDLKTHLIPENWTWCSLEHVGELNRGKSKHRPRNDPKLYAGGTVPLVQTGDVSRSNGVVTTYTALYNNVGVAQSRVWPKGTLCITIAANIAGSGLLSFDACFPDSVVGFIPSPLLGLAAYFEFVIRVFSDTLDRNASSTAQKNINLKVLRSVPIPLPPLSEQKRIVSKVNDFMTICDRLEEALQFKNEKAAAFAQSVIAHELAEENKELTYA